MVETVTIPAAPSGPTLEQQAAALDAAKAAANSANPPLNGEEEAQERPEWLPEKFKTVEDMAKAYAELEKAKGKGKDETPPASEEDANAAVESAGLNMEALSAEYSENGDLSEASYEALAKQGITKEMVEVYISGQEARLQSVRSELLAPVGGDETVYAELTGWAADNLSDAEIESFNSVLESGNVPAIKLAVADLSTKYKNANGTEPGRELGGKPGAGGAAVYESTADLMKDMQNPEYAKNPAFRAKVSAKLERSNIL